MDFDFKMICFSIKVHHIGFSTGWGSVGEFKIWRKEDSEENHNEAFTLGVPHNMVPGSERATAFMIGNPCSCAVCCNCVLVTSRHISRGERWPLVNVCVLFRGCDGANSKQLGQAVEAALRLW